jgi:DNA-binding SARP family transcriptional activator
VEYRILGSLEVVANGTAADLGPPKQRAVLAVLLLHANQIVPTDRLIDLIWPERPPRTALHSIQIYVSELRKAIEPLAGCAPLATRPPGYVLEADRSRSMPIASRGSSGMACVGSATVIQVGA